MKETSGGIWKVNVTKEQTKDTGMALVFVLLLLMLVENRTVLLYAAIAAQVINMLVPAVFRPVAIVWLTVTEMLGAVMSRVVLGVIFFLVVTPIALLRRALGRDTLQLADFKVARDSVLHGRNHTYTGRDLEQPY